MKGSSKKGNAGRGERPALEGMRIELAGEVRRFERRLPHRPEKIWRALTDVKELAAWFPAIVEGACAQDGALRFVFRDGEEPDARGKVTRHEPPRLLELTMGRETLRWELAPIPGGTLLVLTTEVKVETAPANDNAIKACLIAA